MTQVRRSVAAGAALSIALLTGACGGAPSPAKTFRVNMPNLIGLTRQTAERVLRAEGVFDWAEPTRVTRLSPLSFVIAQSPAPGVLIGSSDVVITLAGTKNQPAG